MFCLRAQENRGFNLLEVVIAAFIFSVSAIAFIGVWGMQVRGLEKSRHTLVATFLAEEIVEQAMADGYERTAPTTMPLDEVPYDIDTESLNPTTGVWERHSVTYVTTMQVTEIDGEDPNTDIDDDKVKQILVRVTWEDTTKTGEIVLETFVAGTF